MNVLSPRHYISLRVAYGGMNKINLRLTISPIFSRCSKVKVKCKGKKQSRNRPGVAQRVPGGLGSQISMTFGT